MINILVTGGAGNVGSALVERLASEGSYRVVVLDNLLTGSASKLPKSDNITFIEGDVNVASTVTDVMHDTQFDFVFHYAAVVGVQRTLQNPVLVLNDISGIKNILDMSRATGVKRVFFSSSSEVYGEPVEFPQNEYTTPLNSRLPYAIVKNVGEAFLRSYSKEYGLDHTILRFFNTYGPKQSKDFVISRFIEQAVEGKDITIYGDGSQSRTFCYIDDNIDATMMCLSKDLVVNDVMNVGSDNEISVLELAKKVIEITNSSSKIKFLPALKEGDMTRRKPDNSKMLSILNRPLITLEEGIKRTLQLRKF